MKGLPAEKPKLYYHFPHPLQKTDRIQQEPSLFQVFFSFSFSFLFYFVPYKIFLFSIFLSSLLLPAQPNITREKITEKIKGKQ